MQDEERVDAILAAMAGTADLQSVADEHRLSLVEVLEAVESRRGKQLLRAQRRLAKVHREVIAQVFSAYAVQKLCKLLDAEKPEHVLKGAAALLEMVRGTKKGTGKGGREGEIALTPQDVKELWAAADRLIAAKAEQREIKRLGEGSVQEG